MELTTMYESLGVSRAVYEYGEKILAELKPRFEALDQTAEYNQTKVLAAMQKNKLSAGCFAATTGYGYDDMGREVLEKVYADCFGTEAALVRPQIAIPLRKCAAWFAREDLAVPDVGDRVGAGVEIRRDVR